MSSQSSFISISSRTISSVVCVRQRAYLSKTAATTSQRAQTTGKTVNWSKLTTDTRLRSNCGRRSGEYVWRHSTTAPGEMTADTRTQWMK